MAMFGGGEEEQMEMVREEMGEGEEEECGK